MVQSQLMRTVGLAALGGQLMQTVGLAVLGGQQVQAVGLDEVVLEGGDEIGQLLLWGREHTRHGYDLVVRRVR